MNDLSGSQSDFTWRSMCSKALTGIYIMAALAVIDFFSDWADIVAMLDDGSSLESMFNVDVQQDIILPLLVTIGTLVGMFIHIGGISGMRQVVNTSTAIELSRVKGGFYWFLAAEIVHVIPFFKWLSFIFFIVSYVKIIKGYARLRHSQQFSVPDRAGFDQARTASIFLLIGYLVPRVGSIFTLVGYVLYLLGWNKISSTQLIIADDEASADVVAAESMPEADSEVDEAADETLSANEDDQVITQLLQLDDFKLRLLVDEDQFTNPRIAEACKAELDRRAEVQKQVQAARDKAMEEQRERVERMMAWWRKWRVAVFAALALVIIIAFTGWWRSDAHRYEQALACFDRNDPEAAMEYYAMVTNPRSMEYSEARHCLAMHHLERGDTATAARELTNSVQSGKWESVDAYSLYAELLESGEWTPYLRVDYVAAAELLSKSDEVEHQMDAIRLYYKSRHYDKALSICERYSNYYYAMGFKGLMYLYGKAGLKKSASQAWNLLKQAPDLDPFLVPKADLTLFFNDYICTQAIDDVVSLYATAAQLHPEREDYAMRYRVISNLIHARDTKKDRDPWQTTGCYWYTYYFNSGTSRGHYEGEVCWPDYNSDRSPHGWGVFKFADQETFITKFKMLKSDGESLRILPSGGGIRVQVGTYKNDKWTGGYITDSDGDSY